MVGWRVMLAMVVTAVGMACRASCGTFHSLTMQPRLLGIGCGGCHPVMFHMPVLHSITRM